MLCDGTLTKKTTSQNKCTDPQSYQVHTDVRLGEGSYGNTYEACCGDECSYVLKWTKRNDRNLTNEIRIQQRAASAGLSIPIMEEWMCNDKPRGFIMPRLGQTLYEELVTLSPFQLETVIAYYQSLIQPIRMRLSNAMTDAINETDVRLQHALRRATRVIHFEDIYKEYVDLAKQTLTSIWSPQEAKAILSLGERNIFVIDSPEDKLRKCISILKAMGVANALQLVDIFHRDLHTANLMKQGDRYYAIDFGDARIGEEVEDYDDDVEDDFHHLLHSINNMVVRQRTYRCMLDLKYLNDWAEIILMNDLYKYHIPGTTITYYPRSEEEVIARLTSIFYQRLQASKKGMRQSTKKSRKSRKSRKRRIYVYKYKNKK